MPGLLKQVRFARTKSVKHYTPMTPSPSWSNSTLQSDGPVTPPVVPTGLPPYPPKRSSSYPQPYRSRPARVSSLLALAYPSPISYDVSLPPTTATANYRNLTSRHLSESAVTPPMPFLTIVCPHLPWKVQVTAQDNGAYVTVADVINSIYRSLRTNVASADFHGLPSDKERRMVTVAYENRYRRLRNSREYEHEKNQGLKRVDWLAGRVSFSGLSPSKLGPEVWILTTS